MTTDRSSKDQPAPDGDRKKKLLFVVDSDGAYRYYSGILLQRLDYILHTCKTAEEALELMNVALPSLILADAALPGMGSSAFLKHLKQNPATKAIPVIICSLSDETAVHEAYLREGAVSFLKKPIDPDLLYAAIQKATEPAPRKYIRLTTCLPVVLRDAAAGEQRQEACVSALSEHGAFISMTDPRPKGMIVSLTIRLKDIPISVEGTVLYSFDPKNSPLKTPGMGVQFTRIEPRDQQRIKDFIDARLRGDMPGHR
jgi:twitching motility two-component system response regulator PilH